MLLMCSPQSWRDSDAETRSGGMHSESGKFILHLVHRAGEAIGVSPTCFNRLDAEGRPELCAWALLNDQLRSCAAQHGTMKVTATRGLIQIPQCFYFDSQAAQLIR